MKYAFLFIALLFAGCAEGNETFTLAGVTIQVAKEDFPNEMEWEVAMSSCEYLGNGWRLPSILELAAMHKQLIKHGRGNFKDTWYLSSSEDDYGGAWALYFEDGEVNFEGGTEKENVYRVRPVREI